MNPKILLPLVLLFAAARSAAADFFPPPSDPAPAVIVIAGASGTPAYRAYAHDLAKLGYAVVLVPGKEVCASSSDSCPRFHDASAAHLKSTIAGLQGNKQVKPGKVAVVGFSLGGGGALVHATSLSESIAGVVAYYPSITRLPDPGKVAAQVAVPTLLLSGGRDRYFNCCLVESMRVFAAGVKAESVPFELVVYPSAGHGFNLDGPQHRPDDAADAWQRTTAFLARVLAP